MQKKKIKSDILFVFYLNLCTIYYGTNKYILIYAANTIIINSLVVQQVNGKFVL